MENEEESESQLKKELEELRACNKELKKIESSHKRMEEILSNSEESLRQAQAIAHVGSWEWDFVSNTFTITEEMRKIYGLTKGDKFDTPDSLINKVLHPDDKSYVEKAAQELEKTGKGKTLVYRIVRSDGEVRWISATPPEVRRSKPDGTILIMIGTVQDITDQRRADEALKESEARFRELADLLPQTVFELDMTGKLLYSNKYGFETSGYTQEDIDSGLNATKLFVDEDKKRIIQNIGKILNGETFEDHEYTSLRKDGSTYPVIIFSSPIIRCNKPVGLRGIVIDITDIKNAEKQMTEERNRAELFLDLLTHDINNLNQSIISAGDILLRKGNLPVKNKKFVWNIVHQSKAISKLISNVRMFSKLTEGKLYRKNFEVTRILQESFNRLHQTYPERDIKINHSLPESGIIIYGSELLQDVFDNILGNAVKFKRDDNVVLEISQTLIEDDKFWKFEFIDNGPGVPDDKKEYIFKRFAHGKESVHGSGLGLTIVNEIISHCGGRVWVEDRVSGDSSQGSNFIVVLPKGENTDN